MEKIKLEDGTEREVPTEDELQELKERSETRKKQRDEAKTQLEENKEELGKLQNKDFNFKKLRDLTDEQKSKLSEQEKALMEKQEQLEEQQQSFTTKLKDEWKNESLAVLVGDDDKSRKEVEKNLKLLKIDIESKKDMQDAVRKAYNMTGKSNSVNNPFSYAHGSMGSGAAPGGKKKESKVDLEFAKKFDKNIKEDDLK